MNLQNFNRRKIEDTYKKLEKEIEENIKSNNIESMVNVMLSICKNFLNGRIKIKESNNLFSKYLPICDILENEKLIEIIKLGSSVNTNKDPDYNIRRIRDMLNTIR